MESSKFIVSERFLVADKEEAEKKIKKNIIRLLAKECRKPQSSRQ